MTSISSTAVHPLFNLFTDDAAPAADADDDAADAAADAADNEDGDCRRCPYNIQH